MADIHAGFYWPVARTAQFLSGASTKATPDRIEGSLGIRLKGHDMYRSGPIRSKKATNHNKYPVLLHMHKYVL